MSTNMNGELNGTMDESVETPSVVEKETKLDVNIVLPKEIESDRNDKCNEESKQSENVSSLTENSAENKQVDESGEKLDTIDDEDSEQLQDDSEHEQVSCNTGDEETFCVNGQTTSEVDPLSGDKSNGSELENPINYEHKDDNENQFDSETKGNTAKLETITIMESDKKFSGDEMDSDDCIESLIEDTVSIHSDSDSRASHENDRDDVIILDNEGPQGHNGNSHDSEVHEIDSDNDDCVVTEDEVKKPLLVPKEKKVELRRSSRTIKRKKYDLDSIQEESDIEEILLDDPVRKKSKAIIIDDTKKMLEIAAKHSKNQKKEPTVVIIDTNNLSKNGPSVANKAPASTVSASLYQSMVARGTTVTPVSAKSTSATAQPAILPSLTDDMFVVEAPSFIVPYVYEKPSLKPFREFVDKLGKEIEEQKAKEEKELLEKKKLEKQKRREEREERRKNGEDVQSSDEEVQDDSEESKKKKKARRRRRGDEDDASWDEYESTESDEDMLSDDDMIVKDKSDSIEEIKDLTDASVTKSENYFDCSLGKFFMDIGTNLVQEYVQTDLYNQQKKKMQKEKKMGRCTKERELSLTLLNKNLEKSKENNAPYTLPQKKCEFCSFKTESDIVLANHLETPHMKNNLYRCNFCPFQIKSPHDILFHIEAEHNVKGKLERAPSYHQCSNCPYEDSGKGKLARHLQACAKRFKPEQNLAPPLEWEPPAKIPKIARARNNAMNSYTNNFGRPPVGATIGGRPAMNINNFGMNSYRPRPRQPTRGIPIIPPVIRGSVIRQNAPVNNVKGKQPSLSITPLPRQAIPTPIPVPVSLSQNAKGTFVICEICDGYIKDLEQLRNHMQWIHKVKIHPKMIYNRPPLNCQKCQFRFFTDQGLERHLLGSHGLVTSSMQEAANKGKDAGRCPVCGKVYQWKLLNHVARDHNLTLKPAHLSYKCTVCTATFGMYKQFENHVYSAHSVVAKRVMDKNKAAPTHTKTGNDTNVKPLKINDDITITPHTVNAATAKDK